MTLMVWHGKGHDDSTVSQITPPLGWDLRRWMNRAKDDGGFYLDRAFIPWHRINYVEIA